MRIRLLPAIVAGALLLPAALSAQTTLLYEDFNGEWSTINPPPGWTIVFDGDTSTNDWHRRDSGSVPWIDNLTPYAALSDSPPEQGEDLLISPAIDCEDYNYVVLRCSTKVYTGIGPFTARLIGSVGGGPFDQVIYSYQGVNFKQYQIFDISSWAGGESEVRLCWRFVGSNALISYWCVDNVSVIADSSDWRLGFDSLISWPPDTVDSGSVWPMAVLVRNFGARPFVGTFALELDIGAGYRDTVFVTDTLEPGQGVRVDFDPWTASVPGWHRILCRFALIGSTEDSIIDSVYVRTAVGIDTKEQRSGLSACMTALPNPAHGCVNLALPTPGTKAVRIFDAGGRLLATYPCKGRPEFELDISGFSPGIYFLRAEDQTCRLVIE